MENFITFMVTLPLNVHLYPIRVNFFAVTPEICILFDSELLSIRLAVLTVSPKRQ